MGLNNDLKRLKDPLANLPDDLKNVVSQGMGNITEYLTMATKVIEALATQVIPFKDILKIIGAGSLEQECTFCSKVMNTEELQVNFTPLYLGTYSCESQNCKDKGDAASDDQA